MSSFTMLQHNFACQTKNQTTQLDKQFSEVGNNELPEFVKVVHIPNFVWLRDLRIECIQVLLNVKRVISIGHAR